jgi:hypothetical protein
MVPDLLVASWVGAWAMALTFAVASFLDTDLTPGEVGVILARMFAAALFVAGVFMAMLAMVLLRDERAEREHYVAPGIAGLIAAGTASILVFTTAGPQVAVTVPALILLFAMKPVRKLFAPLVRPLMRRG